MGFADFPVEILKAMRTKHGDGSTLSETGQTISRASTSSSHRQSMSSGIVKRASMDDSRRSPASSTTSLSLQETATTNSETLTEAISPTFAPSPTSDAVDREKRHNSKSDHRSFLGSAIRRRSSSRHSRDKSHVGQGNEESSSLHRSMSDQAQQFSLDTMVGAGHSAGRIVSVGLKSPMDFTLSLARGFHNVPKLYGDNTVRQTEKITDLQSGLKVAGKEFGFGLYDGISGLITQPVDGARKDGIAGFLKGFGKGIAGVVIKPQGAIWALQGYTFKGIYKEIQKHFGATTENYIIAARTSQGYDDLRRSTAREREDVIARWKTVKAEVEKQKQMIKHGIHIDPERCIFRKIAHEKKAKAVEKRTKKDHKHTGRAARSPVPALDETLTPSNHNQGSISRSSTSSDSAIYEEAIQRSVAATSKGNMEQDKMIEQAIRASVQALRNADEEGAHDEAINRAIQASVAEAAHATGIAHDKELEEALHRSLQGHSSSGIHHAKPQMLNADDSGTDTDVEKDMSKPLRGLNTHQPAEDADLRKAIDESERSYNEYQDHLKRQRTEEDIVMEYMKRQSLAEAQFKDSHTAVELADRDEVKGMSSSTTRDTDD